MAEFAVGKDLRRQGSFFVPCKVHIAASIRAVSTVNEESEARKMMNNLHGYGQERQRHDHKPEPIISDSRFIKLRYGPPTEQAG